MGEVRQRRPAWLVAALGASGVLAVATVVIAISADRHPGQVFALVVAAFWFAWMVRKQPLRHALIGLFGVVGIGVAAWFEVDPAAGSMWFAGMPLGWFVREEQAWRKRDTLPSREMWTGWRARAGQVLAVAMVVFVAGAIVWTVVTADGWGDLLASFGPASAVAIAAALGSVVVLVRQLWVRWGTRRWSRDAERDVPAVVAAIAAERELAAAARASRADDASLGRASDHAEMSVLFLESGPRLEAVQELERLLREARSWEPSAPLTRRVADLKSLVRRGRRTSGQVDTELWRGAVRAERPGG